MEQQKTATDNKIFLDAFLGVLLLIAALAFINLGISTLTTGYNIAAGIVGAGSLFLLARAIRNDPSKLPWRE